MPSHYDEKIYQCNVLHCDRNVLHLYMNKSVLKTFRLGNAEIEAIEVLKQRYKKMDEYHVSNLGYMSKDATSKARVDRWQMSDADVVRIALLRELRNNKDS